MRCRGQHIALDVACGLAYLHSQRILHLDLKSPNVLLSESLVAKISDVGLARIMNATHLTSNQGALGGVSSALLPASGIGGCLMCRLPS